MFKGKNILVLAPHTDDGELGCGATISRALREGANVYYIAFSIAEESVPEKYPRNQLEIEVRAATKKLGIPEENLYVLRYKVRKFNYVRQEILEELVRLRSIIKPDIVFLPSRHDIHQDHVTISKEGIRAFKNCSILGYELVWNNLEFTTDFYINVNQDDIDNKIASLVEYKTQEGRTYFDAKFIESLARVRGVQISKEYAEAFEVVRIVM